MFWLCLAFGPYRVEIFNTLSQITGKKSSTLPTQCFIWCLTLTFFILFYERHLAFTTLLARRLILLKWKSPYPPSFLHWTRDVLHFLKLDQNQLVIAWFLRQILQNRFSCLVEKLRFTTIPDWPFTPKCFSPDFMFGKLTSSSGC